MIQVNTIPEETLEYYRKMTAIPLSINNARQLGGLPLKTSGKIKDGMLLRTTQLSDLTKEDRETVITAILEDGGVAEDISRYRDKKGAVKKVP